MNYLCSRLIDIFFVESQPNAQNQALFVRVNVKDVDAVHKSNFLMAAIKVTSQLELRYSNQHNRVITLPHDNPLNHHTNSE